MDTLPLLTLSLDRRHRKQRSEVRTIATGPERSHWNATQATAFGRSTDTATTDGTKGVHQALLTALLSEVSPNGQSSLAELAGGSELLKNLHQRLYGSLSGGASTAAAKERRQTGSTTSASGSGSTASSERGKATSRKSAEDELLWPLAEDSAVVFRNVTKESHV